jgi:allantoicase
VPAATSEEILDDAVAWTSLLPRTPVEPDARHAFDVVSAKPATHARLAIYPDGGVARLRLFGRATG